MDGCWDGCNRRSWTGRYWGYQRLSVEKPGGDSGHANTKVRGTEDMEEALARWTGTERPIATVHRGERAMQQRPPLTMNPSDVRTCV
jgi:hypothetical protein